MYSYQNLDINTSNMGTKKGVYSNIFEELSLISKNRSPISSGDTNTIEFPKIEKTQNSKLLENKAVFKETPQPWSPFSIDKKDKKNYQEVVTNYDSSSSNKQN